MQQGLRCFRVVGPAEKRRGEDCLRTIITKQGKAMGAGQNTEQKGRWQTSLSSSPGYRWCIKQQEGKTAIRRDQGERVFMCLTM